MASIESRRTVYYVRWRGLDGRSHARKCPDHATAKRLKLAIESCLAEGRDWAPARPGGDGASLEVMMADVIRARSMSLRPGSLSNLTLVAGQFLTMLEERRIPARPPSLNRSNLAAFYIWLIEPHATEHNPSVKNQVRVQCKPATAAGRVRMLEGLWRDLAEHDEHGAHVPRPVRLRDLPRVETVLQPAPTWAEMDAAVASAEGWYADLMLVARYTGLRRSQLMALRWEWVDLSTGTLWVHPTIGKTVQERRGRWIPISPHLVAALSRWKRTGPFLIDTGTPGRSVWLKAVSGAWRRGGVREMVWAGDASRRGQALHAFRHGVITGLLAAGAAEYLVQRLVGHAPSSVTIERYADLDQVLMPQLRAVVELIPAVPPLRLAQEG